MLIFRNRSVLFHKLIYYDAQRYSKQTAANSSDSNIVVSVCVNWRKEKKRKTHREEISGTKDKTEKDGKQATLYSQQGHQGQGLLRPKHSLQNTSVLGVCSGQTKAWLGGLRTSVKWSVWDWLGGLFGSQHKLEVNLGIVIGRGGSHYFYLVFCAVNVACACMWLQSLLCINSSVSTTSHRQMRQQGVLANVSKILTKEFWPCASGDMLIKPSSHETLLLLACM